MSSLADDPTSAAGCITSSSSTLSRSPVPDRRAATREDVRVFEGFDQAAVDVGGGVRLRVHHGGSGSPVVLLHGHPRTHTTWHRVAPLLVAAGYTVVCPDLRGYGESSKPATTTDHAPYSKRAMAGDVLALMRQLGHERFAVVGHDRGSYVAARLALDVPHAVTRLAVLDSVPIGEALARADASAVSQY